MFLLFDIGGTKMRFARSDDGVSFSEPSIVETPKEYADGIACFLKMARDLSNGKPFDAVAGGIAGPFGKRGGSLLTSPNLSSWVGEPFREDLAKEFNVPVYIENDSALVGLGEAVVGAGKAPQQRSGQGSWIVAYLTVSTGVGGARIVDSVIDEKSVGFEPGFQVIDMDETVIPETDSMYLSYHISGKSIGRRYGKNPYKIVDEKLWNETLPKALAYGLNNTIVYWSPDIVVLGGSMIVGKNGPTINLSTTETYVKEILKIFPDVPPITKAALGDYGGLHGALALLKETPGVFF